MRRARRRTQFIANVLKDSSNILSSGLFDSDWLRQTRHPVKLIHA
jgi:hypothetical protein